MKRLSIIAMTTTLLALGASSARAIEAKELGAQVLAHYQAIQAALAEDSVRGVREAAAEIGDVVKPCDCTLEESAAAQALVDAARAMDGADLATLREQLEQLSKAMPAYLKVTGVDAAQLYFCPMAKAYWLQSKQDEATRNPYYGKAMPTCGVKVEQVGG